MKKLIKLDFDNTTRERKTEDSYSELYSHDKNNGSFEFEILNDTLTTEQVIALFKFTESNKIWKTTGTVEGNKVKVTFDTSLITQNETVICFLYFDEEQRTSDTFRFKFKVKVSEIDKMNRYEVKERFINNTVIVDRLDVVTKDELKEALKNVGGIATEGLLTEVKAEELYAKKSEAVDNTNFELVKNRVLALELKTDKDTVYDDSEVKERLTTLENKAPVDLSGYATKEELRNVSGSQPLADNLVTKEELEAKHYISDVSNLATKEELNEVRNSQQTVDTSHLVTREELTAKNYLTEHQSLDNLVTKQELEEKQYLTTHQDLSEYAKKSELYNDSDLKARVEVLEQKTDKDTVYDDTPLKERVTALESKAIEGGAYDDKPIRDRLDVLEAKHDNDTIYDDTEVKRRLTEIESKPTVDTSVFVTEEKLSEKGYLTQHQSLENVVTKEELESKGYLTTHQDISNLATKEELANVVTKEELNNKHYVTEEELNNKAYLTSHQDLSNYALKSEIPQPYNDSTLNERVTALESKAIEGGAYDDTDLRNRVVALEGKEDKDTKYDDTDLRNRVTNLENKPPLDTSEFVTNQTLESRGYIKDVSNLVTKDELENKHYLTTHQSLDHVVTKDELASKNYISDVSNLVTKDELASKNYLTEHQPLSEVNNRLDVLEAKQDKDTVYNDEPIKERLTALENKPNVDLTNYVTREQLENKHYLTQHQPLDNLVTKEELNSKGYITEEVLNGKNYLTEDVLNTKNYLTQHQDLSSLVTKQELENKHYLTEHQNISHLVSKDELETKGYLTQHQSLEEYAKKSELYNDTDIKQRLTTLENKPNIDTSNFVTNEQLEGKHYLTEHQSLTHLATTSDLEALRNIAVSKAELSKKLDMTEYNSFKDSVVTKTELAEKGYLTTHQDISNLATKQEVEETYAKKSEIPQAYNDSALVERVTNLENKTDRDTVYDDTSVKERLTTLENKPPVDLSNYALKTEIPQAYNDSELVQKIGQLEARVDKDTVYDDTNIKERLTNLENKPPVDTINFVTNEALEEKHYVTNEQISSTYATKSEIPQPYSDTELVKRITVLENRQDNDTVYDDAELKRRVTALEEKPNVDTSNFVTTAILESKGYLTSHQDTSNFALKSELPQPYNDSALVSRINVLEAKTDNDTVYNDTEVKQRLTALESKPTVDTSNLVTKDELNTLKPNQTLSLNNGTLSISGGNSVALPVSRYEIHGSGMPNGVVEAEIGTTYVDKNKTNGAFKWIKTTDGGNQGWEVLTGDTGWRRLNISSKLNTASLHIRRVNNMVTYQFGGLDWGWFGIIRRGGAGYAAQVTDLERNCYILNHDQVPEGFRTPNSLIGSIYNDNGVPYGTWYIGNTADANHLRFQFLNPVPTDRDIRDIRVSNISYFTDDPWPTQLP